MLWGSTNPLIRKGSKGIEDIHRSGRIRQFFAEIFFLVSNWKVRRISTSAEFCLRDRKHVPCFYRVIETRVKVWENEKCCGNTSRRRVFPQLFRVLPNFHECFYNSIETRKTCFLFLLENTATKKKKTNLFTSIIKM